MLTIDENIGFTPNNIKEVRVEITKALETLKVLGINVEVGTLRYNKNEISTKVTFKPIRTKVPSTTIGVAKIISRIGRLPLSDRELFDKYKDTVIGLENDEGGILVDFKSRNSKYPFIIDRKGIKYKVARSDIY